MTQSEKSKGLGNKSIEIESEFIAIIFTLNIMKKGYWKFRKSGH